jgi:hypothetical protein
VILNQFGNMRVRLAEVRSGSDSESLAASKSSPLVLKQPTYAMIPQKDRVGPIGDIALLAQRVFGFAERGHRFAERDHRGASLDQQFGVAVDP